MPLPDPPEEYLHGHDHHRDYAGDVILEGYRVVIMSGPFEGAEGRVFWLGLRLGRRRVGVEVMARVGHGGEVLVRMFFDPNEVGVI